VTVGPEEHEDLLARVRSATDGVGPAPGAADRVRGALVRRRRRRRAQVGAAVVSSGAALALVGALVVPGLVGDRNGVGPSGDGGEDEGTPSQVIDGGSFRPAGFFRDVVGGVALPTITRFYRTDPGIVLTARFDWAPDPAGASYLADLTLERFRDDPAQRCARLLEQLAQAGACETLRDDIVAARYEVPVDGAHLAPLNEEGTLRLPGSTGVLRGVTAFRPDGRAATVLLCNCDSRDGTVLAEVPPVTFELLEEVVTDPSWGLRVGG
jgi:hypothetical protein